MFSGCHKISLTDNDDAGTIDTNTSENDTGTADTDPGASKSGCVPETWLCVESPTGRQQCLLDETWGEVEPCDICIGQGDCRVQICVENETSCDNGTLKKCNTIGDAYESEEACPSGICDDAKEQCVGCKPAVDIECDVTRQYLLTCNSNGTFDQTDCWAENKTCDNAECTGECVVGHYRCFETSGDDWGDSQVCDGTGTWQSSDECANKSEICDLASGLCTDNAVEYTSGYYSDGADSVRNAGTNSILTTPFVLLEDGTLEFIGVLTTNASLGGEVICAVYDDRIDGDDHYPNNLLGWTSPFSLGTGTTSEGSAYGGAVLSAGTIYWVAVKIKEESGEYIQFHTYPETTMNGWLSDWGTTGELYTVGPSNPFPSTPGNHNGGLSFYVGMQKYWH